MATKGQRAAALLSPIRKKALNPKVIYVRHGTTAFNSGEGQERLRGWLDLPLTKEGISEARDVADELKSLPINKLYTSDLKRAATVASFISKAHPSKPDVTSTSQLRTWDVGEWAGKYVKKIITKYLNYLIIQTDKAPPGGETADNFKTRTVNFALSVFNEAQKNTQKGAIICVSHTANLRVVDGWVKTGVDNPNVDDKVLKDEQHLDTGEALVFELSNGTWKRRTLIPGKSKGGVS